MKLLLKLEELFLLGYGLKYADDFKNTHLGRIGQEPGRLE